MELSIAVWIDCPDCNEGLVERFEDRMNHRGEHYTRDWTEPCERCGGTGHLEVDLNADAALAGNFEPADEHLFVGALTEADVERFAAAETQAVVARLADARRGARSRPPHAYAAARINGRWRTYA